MAVDVFSQPEGLQILSLEDEPEKIHGAFDSLEIEGHRIIWAVNKATAASTLRTTPVDLFVLDQQIEDDIHGGTKLLVALKHGDLGELNQRVPFLFVTGSRDWVDEDAVDKFPGYLGIILKGADLSPRLASLVRQLQPADQPGPDLDPAEMRRVPLLVKAVLGDRVVALVPPWDPSQTFDFPIAQIPAEIRADPESLTGQWMFARINLYEPDPTKLVLMDFETTEPLEDDDGLV